MSCIVIVCGSNCRFDTSLNYIVEGDFEEHGTYQNPVGLSFLDGVIERRIHLTTSKRNQHLGFNIRGGGEYGLGIYVSKYVTIFSVEVLSF